MFRYLSFLKVKSSLFYSASLIESILKYTCFIYDVFDCMLLYLKQKGKGSYKIEAFRSKKLPRTDTSTLKLSVR